MLFFGEEGGLTSCKEAFCVRLLAYRRGLLHIFEFSAQIENQFGLASVAKVGNQSVMAVLSNN